MRTIFSAIGTLIKVILTIIIFFIAGLIGGGPIGFMVALGICSCLWGIGGGEDESYNREPYDPNRAYFENGDFERECNALLATSKPPPPPPVQNVYIDKYLHIDNRVQKRKRKSKPKPARLIELHDENEVK